MIRVAWTMTNGSMRRIGHKRGQSGNQACDDDDHVAGSEPPIFDRSDKEETTEWT